MTGVQLEGVDIYNKDNKVICYTCGLSTWLYRLFKPESCEECPARLSCLAETGCPFDRLIVCHHCRDQYHFYIYGDEIQVRFKL